MKSLSFAAAMIGSVLLLPGCSAPGAAPAADTEREIWALEDEYWARNRGAEPERIVALWHPRFLGWPGSEARPIGADEGPAYLRRSFPAPGAFDFSIEPAGIRVLDDVVVNHYTVRLTGPGPAGQGGTREMRITHTWVRDGGTWKMLGGMSWSP